MREGLELTGQMSWLKRKVILHPLPPSRLPFFLTRATKHRLSLSLERSLSRVCEELEKMGRQRAQLRAMLRKNWLLKIRHPFVTCAEVGGLSFGSIWLPGNCRKRNLVFDFLFIFQLIPGNRTGLTFSLILSFLSLWTIRLWSSLPFFKDRWEKVRTEVKYWTLKEKPGLRGFGFLSQNRTWICNERDIDLFYFSWKKRFELSVLLFIVHWENIRKEMKSLNFIFLSCDGVVISVIFL